MTVPCYKMVHGTLYHVLSGKLSFEERIRFIYSVFRLRPGAIELIESKCHVRLEGPLDLTKNDFLLLEKHANDLTTSLFECVVRTGLSSPYFTFDFVTLRCLSECCSIDIQIGETKALFAMNICFQAGHDGFFIDSSSGTGAEMELQIDIEKTRKTKELYDSFVADGALPPTLVLKVIASMADGDDNAPENFDD